MKAPIIAALACFATSAIADGAVDIYQGNFLGAYALTATCAGQELQVDLMANRVAFGETSCTISQVLTDGVGVILDLATCNAEGEPTDDHRVTLTLSETGGLTYDSAATGTTELLRCTDR
ncbi:MAG: hypothetical protein ACI86S_002267 [Paracoccaceae bacterium]|jgi:hypothetical protein